MNAPTTIRVEVAYALPHQQVLIPLQVPPGTTVEAAIMHSGILEKLADIDLSRNKVGIFSKIVALDARLRDHDRIEIYRPLVADPKEIRRQRASVGKPMRKGSPK